MILWVCNVALALQFVSILAATYRLLVGPTVADRAVALDAIMVHILAMIVVFAIRENTPDYLDAAMVIAILSFLATVAIAKFMKRGVVIDRSAD